ncbi:fibronectin type III domain-containing protein [Paenibacillus qinlingensis]|uniref:Fibronectin type-III domain-containing protein n=1 Tax=Paenibacillus qinlingensis TaxID=1837343 RepID=A0ABU1NTR2_9BACL|nr:fibronectin type III domain-containing protein [Paenibacillus qinlingensis]MDR6550872.1 hypothetical protein [Paenibacillus qinlingensis]
MKEIRLNDDLRHHKYRWPKTLLSYPIELSLADPQVYKLIDEKQREHRYQLSESVSNRQATLSFLTDLPSGSKQIYRLEQADMQSQPPLLGLVMDENEAGCVTITTTVLTVAIRRETSLDESGRYPIFTIGNENIRGAAYLQSNVPLASYELEVRNAGCLYADCVLTAHFADETSYKLQLKIIDEMEFVEMQEELTGFTEEYEGKLVLNWEQFQPQIRYARNRGNEKVDLYKDDNDYLPYKLLPYASYNSWWSTAVASFTDTHKGTSAALFVKGAEQWKYPEYALWGSPENTAIRFRYCMNMDLSGTLQWEYPFISGTRTTAIAIYKSEKNDQYEQKNYVEFLWFWYEFIHLNKVKDWILRWKEDRSQYPRYFPEESMPASGKEVWHYGVRKEPFTPAFMEEMIYHLSHNMNQLYEAGPVSAREFFSWVPVFDMASTKMTDQQFDDFKACFAFMAYAHSSECFMPIDNMLAGHPNFLADMRSVPALMASLFPNHPHAGNWVAQFEKAMARNMKYHIRPDVPAWDSVGGRWTENLGCYNWASLVPMMKTGTLIYRTFGDNVLMYPNITKWTEWMLNTLSAPVDGKRTYPPQGAHSGVHLDPMVPTESVRLLAERLVHYEPLLAEYLMYVCKQDAVTHEERIPKSNLYHVLFDPNLRGNEGTRPRLASMKYTGYGYILRAAVGEESEVSVHLQQIDEGPNYRWGRAGQGGCGVLYYYAAGKRYSYNRPEDVGDYDMGDVQASSNFGVLVGHEYRSIGRNELTEPLYDFGFAQFVQANAGDYAKPFYQSRSVLLSGNDYIVVYDQVGDMRVRGRFAWFVKEGEPFPHIDQLKPGVKGVQVLPGIPADATQDPLRTTHKSKGVVYDGSGDFLTVVTHRQLNCDYNTYTRRTEYGAEVKLQGRTDRIFRDGGIIQYTDQHCSFTGYAGIVRLYGEFKAEAALFKGTSIGALGVKVTVQPIEQEANGSGLSFIIQGGRLSGQVKCAQRVQIKVEWQERETASGYRLYVNAVEYEAELSENHSFTFHLPKGSYTWEWTNLAPTPQETEITSVVVSSHQAEVTWRHAEGASGYQMEQSKDGGQSWTLAGQEISGTRTLLTGLDNESKIHLRVRACHADKCGKWSHDYPVYVTTRVPLAPEGLKVWKWGSAYRILWGRQLGVRGYKLYRRVQGAELFHLIYEGAASEWIDTEISGLPNVYEYAVSACNGNGEGMKSLLRDTAAGGLAEWDPQPEQGFRRYTPSHEYGYHGFDHWGNARKSELRYPDEGIIK